MAGIGLSLQKLTSRGNLSDVIQALGYASLISCGPWLLTISCLAGITWLNALHMDLTIISLFGVIVIYNFSFSLVVFGPLVLIASRYLADSLYSGSIDTIADLCLGSTTIIYVVSIAIAAPFYFFVADLSPGLAAGAVVGYILISMIWITSIFLHAVKNFGMFLVVFFTGMFIAFFFGVVLARYFQATGMLWGFNAGLFIIVYASIGIVFAQYGHDIKRPFIFLRYFGRYWDLAASGLVYNVAIWIDKWIMWFARDNTTITTFMVSNPTYDFPMFLAYISIVPAMTFFTFHTEARFLRLYHKFYRGIEYHESYSWINNRCRDMITCIVDILKNVVIVQSIFTVCAIAFAPVIVSLAGGEFRQIGIYRVGALGAFAQSVFLFITIILFYFDLRKLSLCLQVLFLTCNATFTYLSLGLGFPFYGYGFFLASIISCVVALGVLTGVLRRLPYITFISNNPSVR